MCEEESNSKKILQTRINQMKRILNFGYLKRKHFRDKAKIRSISNNLSNSFDIAFTTASATLQKKLNEAESRKNILTSQTNQILSEIENSSPEPFEIENLDFEPSEKEQALFEKLGESEWLIESNKNSLLSLAEMRVIFLFKTIENAIKEILFIAFPKTQKESLYKWYVMMNLLKNNGVELGKLEGYDAVNQLRIVNNNIKHSSNIAEKTKKIPYWKHETNFTYKNIDTFYNSIHKLIIKFMKDLGEAIVIAVYEISNEKLEEMSHIIFDRLETKRVEMLVIKLEERLKENSKYILCK